MLGAMIGLMVMAAQNIHPPARPKAPRYSDTKRGAARFSFFDFPEPVVVADTNFTRGELPNFIVPMDDGPRGRGGFGGPPLAPSLSKADDASE